MIEMEGVSFKVHKIRHHGDFFALIFAGRRAGRTSPLPLISVPGVKEWEPFFARRSQIGKRE
jgi:hypothetical protein